MIKFIVAAVWLCAATIGAAMFSFSASAPKLAEQKPAPFFGGLDYVKTDIISVPLMRNGSVYGYFLTRLVYTVEPKVAKTLSVPAQDLLVDEVYTYLYGNPQLDFADHAKLDLDTLRDGIRDAINKRVGKTLVHDILVDQIDYLSKSEIRDNTIRRHSDAASPAVAEMSQ